jgi:hypothetical protein
MSERRYVEIEKCVDCRYCGYSTSVNGVIPFCINPDNQEDDSRPRHMVKMETDRLYFPIIDIGDEISIKSVKIPVWCNLPNPEKLKKFE